MRCTLIAVLLFILAITPLAHAENCFQVEGHTLCIVSLQRSAKRYWEYWVRVSIDHERPIKVAINCRGTNPAPTDGASLLLQSDDLIDEVCQLYRH